MSSSSSTETPPIPTVRADQPAPAPNSSNSPPPNVTFPLGSCWSFPLRRPVDLADPWKSSAAWATALSPAHRTTLESGILLSQQQVAFRGCIVFPFGTLTGGLDVLFLCSDGSTHLLSALAAQLPSSSAGNPVSSCNPHCVGPADERKLRTLPASGLRVNDRIAATAADPRLGALVGCFSDDPTTCSTLNRPDSSIVGPLTCSSRRPTAMSDAGPSSSAPQAPPPAPSSPAAQISNSNDTLVIVLSTLAGVVVFSLLAWILARHRKNRQYTRKADTYSVHEVLVSPRFMPPAMIAAPTSPYTTGAGSMTAVVIDSTTNVKSGGHGHGHAGAKLLISDTTDDITVVFRETPMSGETALDHSVEHAAVRPGTPAAAAWGVCISPAPSNVGSLLSPCSDRSADSLLELPPLHLHEQKYHHFNNPESLDADRPVRSPTATAGHLLRRSLSIGRHEKNSGLKRKSSTRRSKSNDSSAPTSQMDLAGCSVTLSSFGLRPCPPAARRPTSGRRGHTKHEYPTDSHTPPPTHSLSTDSTALLSEWFSMFQDLNDVATAYVGSAGRQHRAVVLVRLSSLLRPFLDNIISNQLFALCHGLSSAASSSPAAPKPKYLHFLFQDVLSSSPSEDPIAVVVNQAIATFLGDLTHAFPSLARSQVPRGTRYDTWSEYLWTQAMRWYRIKAQRPFAALVEPQPGSQVRERLMVVVGRAEELDEELGCEPSPPRACELVGAAEYDKEHGDSKSQEYESVVAWCVFPALVDLERSKVIAKARVYVGVEHGVVD